MKSIRYFHGSYPSDVHSTYFRSPPERLSFYIRPKNIYMLGLEIYICNYAVPVNLKKYVITERYILPTYPNLTEDEYVPINYF